MTKSADKELLRASFKLEYPYERSPGPIIGKFFEELSNEVLVGTKNSKGEIFVPAAEFDPKDSEHLSEFVEVKMRVWFSHIHGLKNLELIIL